MPRSLRPGEVGVAKQRRRGRVAGLLGGEDNVQSPEGSVSVVSSQNPRIARGQWQRQAESEDGK